MDLKSTLTKSLMKPKRNYGLLLTIKSNSSEINFPHSFNSIKTEYTQKIESQKADLLAKQGEATKGVEEKANASTNKAKKELENKVKDKLKGFKF